MAQEDELRMEAENLDLRRLLAASGIVVAEQEVSAKLQRLLLEEVHHRVKNMLATVMAITSQTLNSADTLEHGREAVQLRLLALGRTQDLLLQTNFTSADLSAVVASAIAPFEAVAGDRFRLRLVDLSLTASAVLPLALLLHELITNALKYGALSNDTGHVAIDAFVAGDQFHLQWSETGGPVVAEPTRRSFGSKLVERGLVRQLGGTAKLQFAASGVQCTVELPLESVEAARDIN